MTTPNPMACPLCKQEGHAEILMNYARAGCPNCGLWLSRGSAAEAISAWNTRAPQTGEGVPESVLAALNHYAEDHHTVWMLNGEGYTCVSSCGRCKIDAALNALKGESK